MRCIDDNRYNLFNNNCAIVAIHAWNSVFIYDSFDETIKPTELRKQIKEREGSFVFKMKDILPALP